MPPLSPDGAAKRIVALAGATGLVGRAILEGLLADSSVAAVHALGRRRAVARRGGRQILPRHLMQRRMTAGSKWCHLNEDLFCFTNILLGGDG